jgi:MYXO-CTERM domain-containing protein
MAICQQDPSCIPPPTINFTGIGGGGCACDVAGREAPSGVFMLAVALGVVLFRRTRGGRR